MSDNSLREQIYEAEKLADKLITFDVVSKPKQEKVKESIRLDVTKYTKEIKPEGDKVKITVEIPMEEYNKNFRKYLSSGMDLSVSVRSHVDKGE